MNLFIGKQAIRCMALALLLEVMMVTITNAVPGNPPSREHFRRSHHGS